MAKEQRAAANPTAECCVEWRRVIEPPPDLRMPTPNGVAHKSVEMYRAHANGLRAVVFCNTVELAKMIADSFKHAGISAEYISGSTNPTDRAATISRLSSGETLVLCGAQVLDQMDLSAEAVIDLRPTHSKAVFTGHVATARKPPAIIIDMAGNALRHGIPLEFKGKVFASINDFQHLAGLAGTQTMEEKDYSLLRPFDLEAAKRGDAILWGGQWEPATFVGRSRSGKTNIIECEGMHAGLFDRILYAPDEYLRMAPLCWVEGRPVYKGDGPLFPITSTPVLGSGPFTVVSDQGDGKIRVRTDNGAVPTCCVENLTWTTPKVKREVKLLAWFCDTGELRLFDGKTPISVNWKRVPSEDKVISVEEPAGQEGGAA